MTAFFNISVWITLAMVIPGLVSMATLFGAMVVGDTCSLLPAASAVKEFSDWAVAGVAVTIMIMTQAVGILLESFLVDHKWLGPETIASSSPRALIPLAREPLNCSPTPNTRACTCCWRNCETTRIPTDTCSGRWPSFFFPTTPWSPLRSALSARCGMW